jgi:hypothetical protein
LPQWTSTSPNQGNTLLKNSYDKWNINGDKQTGRPTSWKSCGLNITQMSKGTRVDTEMKKAVKGKSSKACNLPDYLKEDKLPLSVTAVKQEFKKELMKRWKTNWEGSP